MVPQRGWIWTIWSIRSARKLSSKQKPAKCFEGETAFSWIQCPRFTQWYRKQCFFDWKKRCRLNFTKCLIFKCQNLDAKCPTDLAHPTHLPGYPSSSSLTEQLQYLIRTESCLLEDYLSKRRNGIFWLLLRSLKRRFLSCSPDTTTNCSNDFDFLGIRKLFQSIL